MAYCIKCYDQLPVGAEFCIECGARQPTEGPTELLVTDAEKALNQCTAHTMLSPWHNLSAQRIPFEGPTQRLPVLGLDMYGHTDGSRVNAIVWQGRTWVLGASMLYWSDNAMLERDARTGELHERVVKMGIRLADCGDDWWPDEIEEDSDADNESD